jgi:hypothetical protein
MRSRPDSRATVRRSVFAGTAAALLAVLAGCSGTPGNDAVAGNVTAHFAEALAAGDADTACTLLATQTRATLEAETGESCTDAIVALQLPAGGTVHSTKAYARAAESVLDFDVIFLSLEPTGWKVTAAGCRERPGLPYQCELKGE